MFEFYLLMSAVFLGVVILVVVLVVVNKRQNQSDDALDKNAFEINDNMIDAGDVTFEADVKASDTTLNKTVEDNDDDFKDERLMNRLNNVVERRTRDE